MKAFVTGASGFTGSHLVQALTHRGDTVVALVRKSSDLSRLANCPVELVYGDITDRAALEKAITGVDVVFHIAAYVELGIVDADLMQRVNVEGTRAILETAKAAGVSRMVYCSTVGVFGHTAGRIVDETYQREQTTFDSPYDVTKYQAQQLVDEFAAQGFPVISIFPSGIFGADDPHFGPVVQRFLKGGLSIWPGGERITGIVHVDDLVDAMLLAVEKGKPGEWYIASSGDMSIREMFALLGKEKGIPAPKEAPRWLVYLAANILDPLGHWFKWNPPISHERVRYIYDRCVRVDASKARRELGWQPRSVEETLKTLTVES